MIPAGIRGFWHLLQLPCEGMSRLASESLDRDLGRLETWALRSHQLYCRGCHRYGKQLRFLHVAACELHKSIEVESPASTNARHSHLATLPETDRIRIKQALRDDLRSREAID